MPDHNNKYMSDSLGSLAIKGNDLYNIPHIDDEADVVGIMQSPCLSWFYFFFLFLWNSCTYLTTDCNYFKSV